MHLKTEEGKEISPKCETIGGMQSTLGRGLKEGRRQFGTSAPGYGSATIYGSIWVGPDLKPAKNYENWTEFSAGSRSQALQEGMEKVMPDKVSKKYVKVFF